MDGIAPGAGAVYPLGHTRRELSRLIEQARYFGQLTDQVLRAAGIVQGMRVLDAGSGAGDVSFLVASLVGPGGSVLGVDRSPDAVALATQRAAEAELDNVRFRAADLSDLTLDESFDAVVGRLVLMYQPDPAAVVRRLAGLVAPGGIVVFHEFDLAGCVSEPPCPLFDETIDRMRRAFAAVGADPRAGLHLGRVFEDAGLPSPRMMLAARTERGPDAGAFAQIERVMRTLLPVLERTGVATPAEIGIDTLAERLRDEAVARRATLVAPPFVGAWTRVPAGIAVG
jgi:SAM-dependent methyltransferase